MKTILFLALFASISACVTSPTDPAALAAWNAEKTARTAARRPEPGRISHDQSSSFEALKKEFPRDDYANSNWQ